VSVLTPSLSVPTLSSRIEESSPEDVTQSPSFALLYTGRKRARDTDTMMADIVANRLPLSGYVYMKRPAPDEQKAIKSSHNRQVGTTIAARGADDRLFHK
jgi:hypothetical protein